MAPFTTSALLAVGLLACSSSAQTNCTTTGVHMIIARASTEQPGTGIIGTVATQVQQQIPGSDVVAVDYPATLENYVTSESQGVVAMTKLIMDYASACPNSKIVLMGYSQVRGGKSRTLWTEVFGSRADAAVSTDLRRSGRS